MARRARVLTREDLLHRYANAKGWTFGQAHDAGYALNNEQLRDVVENAERHLGTQPGQRKSFAQSQPTTTVRGQTR